MACTFSILFHQLNEIKYPHELFTTAAKLVTTASRNLWQCCLLIFERSIKKQKIQASGKTMTKHNTFQCGHTWNPTAALSFLPLELKVLDACHLSENLENTQNRKDMEACMGSHGILVTRQGRDYCRELGKRAMQLLTNVTLKTHAELKTC